MNTDSLNTKLLQIKEMLEKMSPAEKAKQASLASSFNKDPTLKEKAKNTAPKEPYKVPNPNFKGSAPSKQGSTHNEAYTATYVNGHRKVSGSYKDKTTDEHKFANRKIDNKVTTTHLWNDNSKEWKHHKTEHTLGGLNVDGTHKAGATSTKRPSKPSNATSTMDAARKKAATYEKESKKKPVETKKKTKTIRRKSKKELVKALNDAGFRQSALLLKNWDTYDVKAKELLED